MNEIINIAIDGPSGAGKSTIAKAAAAQLGYIYIDTGALYRTVALCAIRNKVDLKNSVEIADLIKTKPEISLIYENGTQKVLLFGEDVSFDIRLPEVSMAASAVSAVPQVREYLFDLQRNLAKQNSCIMDGRDIGTVVLPDAKIKIYLTASAESRAERRMLELTQKGIEVSFEEVLKDINQRDYNDMHRKIAPLKQAADAIVLDTSGNELEQSIELVLSTIKANL